MGVKEELRDRFGKFGEIGDVYITRNRSLAFVRFVEKSSAEDSVDNLDGKTVVGKEINVSLAEQKKRQPEEYPEEIRQQRNGGNRSRRGRDRRRERDRGRRRNQDRGRDRGRHRGRGGGDTKRRGGDRRREYRDDYYSYDYYYDDY